MESISQAAPDLETRTVNRVMLRLIPFIVFLGLLKDWTHSYKAGLAAAAAALVLAGALTLRAGFGVRASARSDTP